MKRKKVNKGHIKDMNGETDNNISLEQAASTKNLVVIKLFEKDNFLLFVYKKTERIVSALYLMGDLLPDNEPIKWKLREVGIAIISRIMSFTTNPMLKSEIISGITSDLLKIQSFIEIAFWANLISKMNFAILKKELEDLLETLSSQSASRQEFKDKNVTINKEFFAVSDDLFIQSGKVDQTQNTIPEPDNISQPIYSWSNVQGLKMGGVVQGQYKGQQNVKDRKLFSGDRVSSNDKIISKGRVSQNTLAGERQTLIMKMLNNGSSLKIKDFSLVIKGCSEKTIQRELLRLVKLGVLKKDGERRWSRYSLVV